MIFVSHLLFLFTHLMKGLVLPCTQRHCHILCHDNRRNQCKLIASDGNGYNVSKLEQDFFDKRAGELRVYQSIRVSHSNVRGSICAE